MGLSKIDTELLECYKAAKVFDSLDGHKLDAKSGLILVTCGDPDQFMEQFQYKVDTIVESGCCKRIQPMTPLGGALRLAHDSPANRETPFYAESLLFDMRYVTEHKDVSTVALYIHAPCAMAAYAGMSFRDIIEAAFSAKQRIKEELPGVKVAVFCHVDYGEGRKKTYFVCRSRWAQYHSGPMAHLAMLFPDRFTILNQTPGH
ncbi:MAG: hypothetical protein KW793_00900 [Candidatus Doudnabacteria bacterium]|nr:hypothetical protein [Candidatus Doudnabacteria bacterium]